MTEKNPSFQTFLDQSCHITFEQNVTLAHLIVLYKCGRPKYMYCPEEMRSHLKYKSNETYFKQIFASSYRQN